MITDSNDAIAAPVKIRTGASSGLARTSMTEKIYHIERLVHEGDLSIWSSSFTGNARDRRRTRRARARLQAAAVRTAALKWSWRMDKSVKCSGLRQEVDGCSL